MLDDTAIQARAKLGKPAVGNGSVALYARVDRYFCFTFRQGVKVSTLLNNLASCHELLLDEPLWGPDWVAVGYNKKAVDELAATKNAENTEIARRLIVNEVFAAIWRGLFTGAVNGHELVTSPTPPQLVPEVDLGVLLHRHAQW